jgi:hypothetical protein
MAARKSINLLPGVFRTDVNEKFLSATLDQLISEPSLKNLYGYIGRKFAPTFAQADSYITEDSDQRQNYQLEPATIIKDLDSNTTFFASYIDFLDKIKYYGGFINDHSRLFSSEYYSFDPKISFDKFVNFGQYYWLPNGPAAVQVNTSGVELIKTFIVTRNDATNSYDFASGGIINNTLILARGGTYTFTVNQPSKFYIQSELGIDGLLNVSPTISSRDVLGVTNNGATSGNVIFNVPQKNAQDRYLAMTLVASVDYAVPLAFSNIQNRLLGDFVTDYPQYAGLTGSLDGKTVIFVDQNLLTNFGEEAWTVAGEEDSVSITYDKGSVVPDALRYGVWKIQLIPTGSDYLINVYPFAAVAIDQKVYIRYGLVNANQEFYKEFTGFFERMPLITATANSLVIQDSLRSDIYAKIKIVDPSDFNIDVEDDILGELNYTSPNGVEFTSGLKIQFDTDVTPTAYQGNTYIVENVGDSIRLVDTELLVKPESYNDELATNYPVQQIVLSLATNAVIPGGTVITVGSFTIETNKETTLGAIKITTLNSVDAITKGMTVTGNGITSGTTVYDAFAETVFPDYITIKRDALDLNAWSRNNCWYHVDVIKATAEYNDDVLILDQRLRAQRPIVQFEGDLQLFNHGRIGKRYIDILDTNITDAFNQLEGQLVDDGGTITYVPQPAPNPAEVYYDGVLVGTADTVNFIGDGAFGVTLFDGMRVLFAEDEDPLVRDKIYVLNIVQFEVDTLGRPTGAKHIKLTVADDGDAEEWDSVVVRIGQRKGSAWWYDGSQWLESQQKTELQQDPLFDVYDGDGRSLSDIDYYPRSNFNGTKLFGYQRNTSGSDDAVLGFPLSYRSFQSQGDILFSNYFNTDTFTYVIDQETITENISIGFLQSISDRTTTLAKNTWLTVSEPSRQYQLLTFEYNGTNSPFVLNITPNAQNVHGTTNTIPYVKVYQNKIYLSQDKWSLTTNRLTVSTTLAVGDIIDVEVYSSQISTAGYYEIPLNLDLNAQNTDIQDLTLGQIRNHVVELSRNSTNVVGDVLGACNLRDIEIKSQGGTILQHSAPLPYAQLFLLDQQANFIDSVKLAQREYTKFKNKFLELAVSLPGIDPTNPVVSVDLIITQINLNKTPTMPWFYSDMIPYGTLKNTITYTVFDPFVLSYEITTIFSSVTLTNTAVLVYLNNVQLILGIDYTFDTLRPAITINDTVITLAVDDIITVVEYTNTDGSYIPETPSKLGTYPKFKPEIVADDTYRSTINVIRGHDGSITPAFNDYRDNFLLELEKRIYNNIKLPDSGTYQDIFSVLPGKFRDNGYSYTELWNILSKNFLTWVGNNRIADFSENNIFESSEQFTWNYSRFTDRLDSESMVGSWRAVYLYFYDTIYPHTRPWEMLGFSTRPNWWEDFYGPGPYTGGNKLLWDDLEAGRIRDGQRATENVGYGVGIDPKYRRPRLSQVIPVDDNGYLLSPAQVIAKAAVGKNAATAWAVGQLGPVEWAWRTSSEYPYAVQQAVALAKPGLYFGQFIDTYKIQYNSVLGQYLTDRNHHVRQTDITYNGDNSSGTVIRSAGYLNWIADYLRNLGINPSTKITNMLQNYNVKLAYKMAGYSDKKYLQILAEQSSPTSTNASIILPEENYDVVLYKSTPVDTVIYSAVIVEKTTNGFTVRGYDLNSPYFTIIPSVVNNNGYKITVLNSSGTVFNDYKKIKLTVPYGYEFKNTQQVVDFLISYERYLISQGFTFNDRDGDLGETRNFKLSVKEFLFWSQQGWKTGTLLVMSPVTNSISLVTVGNIVDEVSDSQHGSKIVDQNFNLVKKTGYQVLRNAAGFKVTLADDNVLALVKLDLVQFEHVLTFDNTTVFNDVIYKPELGNRQYRLKLIGQKTDLWDGSLYAPGFIYNNKTVQPWIAGKDYLKGELVEFKDQYYVALGNVAASTEFLYAFWKQLSSSEIQTGLLNNFSTLAVGSKSFYDSYGTLRDNDQLAYSHGLIGFKPRQYLADLGVSDTTQIEFYKGYIRQKGSTNAVDALTKARFNNLSGNISLYEEWAVRIGEYGALDSNPYIEISLDEQIFSVNPAVAEFVDIGDSNLGNGLTVFNKSQLYKSTDGFNGNIALNRDNYSDYDNDILTAGYVHLEDVSTTIYDIANYTELNDQLADIGAGYTIWCAKDFSGKWNVYRVSETNNPVTNLSNALDGFITWTTTTPHGLAQNDIFLIRGFNNNFNGFYQVYAVLDLNRVTVRYQGAAENLDDLNILTGNGILFVLNSLRFTYMEDSRVYGLTNPLNRWRVGEKIWIDEDAATDTIQGQPYNTPSGGWKVYEKTESWSYDQTLLKSSGDYKANDGFGTSVKLSYDGLLAAVGSPYANSLPYYSGGVEETTGRVNTFDKNYAGLFVNGFTLVPTAGNAAVTNREFGHSVDQALGKIAVGAPGSYANIGLVYVYDRVAGTTDFSKPSIIWSGGAGDRFGSSISFDENGTWLYVGAPGNDRVYVYGLNKYVSTQEQIISVNNRNIIRLSGNISIANLATISNPDNGATATVLSFTGNTFLNSHWAANIVVSTLTGFTEGNISANIYVNNFNSNLYANLLFTFSNTSTITTSFVPEVTGIAESLLVTNSNRVFIPNLDYTVSGTLITFTNNLTQDVYAIKQQPYYALSTTIQGPSGSDFGYSMDSSLDGAQLGVGAPSANVFVGNSWVQAAGAVYVYDRVIEAFESTGNLDYITTGNIDTVHRVTIDNIEVTNYTIPGGIGSNTIRFINPPALGKTVYIETNQFNLLEQLIGVDSLEGGTDAIQANAAFGTDLTICSNNCAIYVGAPYYNAGSNYNTGAVWKFHNRGRLYGTNNGYTVDPILTPGDTLRLDNFEITVQGRMMPTTFDANTASTISGVPLIYVSANILALSSNIVANVGQVISQNLGSGYYANVIVLANTTPSSSNTVVGSKFITVGGNVRLGGQLTANVFNYGPGNVVTLYANASSGYSGTVSTAYPMASLDSLIQDINDAELLGITAANENNTLRLNTNKTVAKNLLRVLTGTNSLGSAGVYAALDMKIFAFMQIIVNPYNTPGEYFGNKVVLAQNAYMLIIGSERGTTRSYARFDVVTTSNVAIATTTLDVDSTRFFDSVSGSGSVYIYELYDDPRDEVEAPGRYSFAQQLRVPNLDPDNLDDELNIGDRFGAAIDIIGTNIIVSAPSDDTIDVDGNPLTKDNAGSIYIFANPAMTRGWNLIRYQEDKVDVDSVNRIFLYSNQTNTILTNLEFIDPAKGKILGLADQEITYKTEYDPAVYNRGTNANSNYYWGTEQVNQVWWNLSQVRFIDYEQGSLTYRSINWGRLFPGSVIEVCEWVESSVLPSQYIEAGFDGRPKYADNSQYVEIVRVDPNTNIIGSTYYFWVTNKTSLTGNDPTRTLPIQSVANYINDPKGQGIAYAAIIKKDAIILYNVGNYLSAQNTILHLDYDMLKNTNVIHSEYELIQKSNPVSLIPEKISSKMIDSLSGVDTLGRIVPDPRLSLADQYGISVRPRQSMFIDRLRAMSDLIEYVNDILINKPIARQYDLTTLSAEETRPSIKLGEYDLAIATEDDLNYIDTASLSAGYRVLVEQNTAQDNLWTLHELQSDDTWDIVRVQSYKSSLYWEYVDWYAEGFSSDEVIEYIVETLPDALKLPVAVGDEVLVRVNSSTGGGFNLLTVLGDGSFRVVGIENGTIQLKTSLSNFADNGIGLGNQGFDSSRFDQSPNIEIRYILEGLKNDIFINELQGTYNDLFFVMMNYLLSEQKYVDWLFKTSFVSVTHNLRALTQPANYIKDNITYYENYINEVKPYITKIREYLTNYDGNDNFEGTITDFDLAPYFDPDTKIFRSPDGTFIEKDRQLWATGYLISNGGLINPDYPQWYQNRNFYVDEIIITNPGSGYTTEPTITITGGGANVQATATAEIDGDTGTITSITVVTPGNGYYLTPTVTINGSAVTEATAYAVLRNNQLRTFDTTLKFDRISYGTTVEQWSTGTFFLANAIVSYGGQGYRVLANITTGSTFVTSDYVLYSANNFSNANDRIMAYYDPTNTMPAKDLNQLIPGIEYPGVKVQGLDFNQQPGFSGEIRANITFNTAISTAVGEVITQPEADIILNFSNVITANIGQTISQYQGAGIYANATVYGNTMSNGVTQGNITSSLTGYFLKNDEFIFDATNQIKIDGISQFSNVFVANANVILSYWSNLAIKPISSTIGGIVSVETAVPDASITVTRVWSSVKIQGTISSSSDFLVGNIANSSIRNGNIKIGSTWVTAYPINVDYVSTTAGTPFDSGDFDNIDYDEDGNPIVSENSIDTIIRSTYLDTALGTRPEDIDVDGGAYFDTYSSHAPEELVPGRTFDTLDMVVYTKINSNANVIAYRIFDNMVDDVKYLRVADRFSTTLTSPLYFNDANISVANAAALFTPNLSSNEPGVIFIGAERITYWTANTVSNTLGRIRRGTQGTAAANTYNIGTSVIDSSTQQIVPGSAHGNILLTASNIFTVTGTISYNLRVSSNISANVGDVLTQVTSGASATVVGADLITSSLLVVYNSAVDFNHSNVTVGLSGNLQANIGSYITQTSSGANLQIVLTNTGGTNVLARYTTVTQLITGLGNLKLNGSNVGVYPTSVGTNPVVTSNLAINGNYSNVYPYARQQAGSADIVSVGGNVTVGAGNVLIRANIWYNLGSGAATDGTGFNGAITNAVLFLKDATANNLVVAGTSDELSTEDTINTITTEDGRKIIEEDQ